MIFAAARAEAIYVLHALQKKTQATAKHDIELAKKRLAELTNELREQKPMTEEVETYASAWDAIADTPEAAANLGVRAELIRQIVAIIETNGWK